MRHRLFKTFNPVHLDFALIILIVILNTIGVLAVGSAQHDLQGRQLQGMIAGLILMILISGLDYRKVLDYYWAYYLISCFLLALIFTPLGVYHGDARRWINVGIQIQPSEIAKILLILFYAKFIMVYKSRVKKYIWVSLCLLLAVPPIALIAREPDLSTTIMVAIIIAVILFVSGLSIRLVLGITVVSVPLFIVIVSMIDRGADSAVHLLNQYQRNRVLAWLHPEDYATGLAYQTMNSIMAIGSGQLLGKGYNTNEISSLLNSGYISESQTDFIFTVIGEEFGFVGSSIVVLLLTLITIRCFMIARGAKDTGGSVIAAGVGTWIGFQGFMNIAVATGILPNTGIPLPFVSYGLTSLLSLYLGVGFVLNVRMQSMQKTARTAHNFGGIA